MGLQKKKQIIRCLNLKYIRKWVQENNKNHQSVFTARHKLDKLQSNISDKFRQDIRTYDRPLEIVKALVDFASEHIICTTSVDGGKVVQFPYR